MNASLGIYVHIPYCLKKCAYCDFFSTPREREEIPHAEYLGAIKRQLSTDVQRLGLDGRNISTIYFGGGTPSLMPPSFFGRVIESIAKHFSIENDAEISCEVNPATVGGEWFKSVHDAGITRASIGIQSFNPKFLDILGRIHSSEDAMRAIALAQDTGFNSVSLDLIYAITGETTSELEGDLRTAMTFQPEHISAYQLTIEAGTPFAERKVELPSEDEQLKQMRLPSRMLERSGWQRYEISNFAKPGFECLHNLNYWRYGEYLGLGAGATSFIGNARWTQVRDMQKYIAVIGALAESEEIDDRTAMAEFCFMGLRTIKGISEQEFEERFGKKIDAVFGDAIQSPLLKRAQGAIFLTQKGFELSNQVFSKFM